MTLHASQRDLQCPSCAGQCRYNPAARALTCDSCATSIDISHDADADPAREFHYHPDLPHTEQSQTTHVRSHSCQTCGGSVVFTGPALSERCAYCDGPVVLTSDASSYNILGLIPFHIDAATAQSHALTWAQKRIAAPTTLGTIVSAGRVAGVYAPFFTFDCNEAIDYLVKYKVKRGKNWYRRQVSGAMNIAFDDLLMPASAHVTPLIRDGILHDFDPDSLRPFDPAYLAGFAAERHHMTVAEGLSANEPDKDLLIRNRIRSHSGRRNITAISYKTDTTGIRYRRILLPVWVLHYVYRGTALKIVVCGLHGRAFGERPFSPWKLSAYATAVSAAATACGWFWGAAGIF